MKTTRKKEWFDDESFWVTMYPFMFSDKQFDVAIEQCEKLLALLEPDGKSVLDLCCGPGRFSVPLAKKDFLVTGVDRTKFLLEKAKARAKAEKVSIEWVQQDMRDFVRPDAYDLVLSMFTSFGYFDNEQENIDVLRNMFTNLKEDGKCLIELMGKERLARIFQSTTSEVLPDGSMLVQRHEVIDDWTSVRNEWILIQDGKAKSFKFDLTTYSGQELRDCLERVGFRDVKLYGNLDGEAYGLNALRLIAVGRKSAAGGEWGIEHRIRQVAETSNVRRGMGGGRSAFSVQMREKEGEGEWELLEC